MRSRRVKELGSMVQDGDITLELPRNDLNITVPELEKRMLENGYRVSGNVMNVMHVKLPM